MPKEVRTYWEENPDQRIGQVLINLNLVPDDFKVWHDEEPDILLSQDYQHRDIHFWGRNFDKDMNRLPKTEWILIKDMSTEHIEAILDGGWVNDGDPYKTYFEEELILRKK